MRVGNRNLGPQSCAMTYAGAMQCENLALIGKLHKHTAVTTAAAATAAATAAAVAATRRPSQHPARPGHCSIQPGQARPLQQPSRPSHCRNQPGQAIVAASPARPLGHPARPGNLFHRKVARCRAIGCLWPNSIRPKDPAKTAASSRIKRRLRRGPRAFQIWPGRAASSWIFNNIAGMQIRPGLASSSRIKPMGCGAPLSLRSSFPPC